MSDFIYVCEYLYTYVYILMYMCVCVYIYIYITYSLIIVCIYIYIYIYGRAGVIFKSITILEKHLSLKKYLYAVILIALLLLPYLTHAYMHLHLQLYVSELLMVSYVVKLIITSDFDSHWVSSTSACMPNSS